MDFHWLSSDINILNNIHDYTYDYWLVGLSYLVAALSSYISVLTLQRFVNSPKGLVKFIWLMAGAITMGGGIWSMHFVAMLAVKMDMVVLFDAPLTILSFLFAVAASIFVYWFVCTYDRSLKKLLFAGTVLGSGIGAMHYTGMAAMHMNAEIYYDPYIFAASIVVAVFLASISIRLIYLRQEKDSKLGLSISTALVMGLAVSLMHYTGMWATTFVDVPAHELTGFSMNNQELPWFVVIISLLSLTLVGFATVIGGNFESKNEAISLNKNRLQAFINTAHEAIISVDRDGFLQSYNPSTLQIFGYKNKELAGQRLSHLIPEAQMSGWLKNIASELFKGVSGNVDNYIDVIGHHKDGTALFLTLSVNDLMLKGETQYSAIIRDVSQEHESQEKLQAQRVAIASSQQQLHAIVNSVIDGVIGFDRTGKIHMFNNSAEQIFGYSVHEVDDISIDVFLPEEDRQKHMEGLELFLETGSSPTVGHLLEYTGVKKDGTTFPFEMAISWREVDNEIIFVSQCRDITSKKLAEEERIALENELRQAQKMESLGVLSGGIAHEINTPVQYVGDNIKFLQTGFTDIRRLCSQLRKLTKAASAKGYLPELTEETARLAEEVDLEFLIDEIPEAIDQSLEGVERISEIVKAIKEFSHPDTKEKTSTNINAALNTTIMVSRNQWKYIAELETDLDEELPHVMCLPGEFNQVILNLIVNAAHAIEDASGDSGELGKITVSTKHDDDFVDITVRDSGTGIDPDKLTTIFDPFFTTKEPGKGTGQGLAISHNIITKKHGGQIWATSELGHGATFHIKLPLNEEKTAEVAAE